MSKPLPDQLETRSAKPETVKFVWSVATFDHYGGGQRGRIRVAEGVVLESLDAWEGTDTLVNRLSLKLEDHLSGLALK